MTPCDQTAALDAVAFLLERPGADATWSVNDQVLGDGQVVTVTVRARVTRADSFTNYRTRHVATLPASDVNDGAVIVRGRE